MNKKFFRHRIIILLIQLGNKKGPFYDREFRNRLGCYGAFTSAITGLTSGSKYYIRAYATNTQGTGYGNNIILLGGSVSYGEGSGIIAVVEERFHYVGASGREYYIQGTAVPE